MFRNLLSSSHRRIVGLSSATASSSTSSLFRLNANANPTLKRNSFLTSNVRTIATATFPTDRVYVTSTQGTRKDAPILIGLMDSFEAHAKSVGYFRPIIPVTKNGREPHVEVMKNEFNLNENIEELYVMNQDEAVQKWIRGERDELIFDILNKFEALRLKHDFIVIEGTRANIGEAVLWELNAEIAKALNAPILLSLDCEFQTRKRNKESYLSLIDNTALAYAEVLQSDLDVAGIVLNRVRIPSQPKYKIESGSKKNDEIATLNDVKSLLAKSFGERRIPYLGMVPYDEVLASPHINELVDSIHAIPLYNKEINMSRKVYTDVIVASTDLRSLLEIIHERAIDQCPECDPEKIGEENENSGMLIITNAIRTDILLGLLVASCSPNFPRIAGILVTGKHRLDSHTLNIFKDLQAHSTVQYHVPVYAVDEDSYTTASLVSRINSDILASSDKKIARSKHLFNEHVNNAVLVEKLKTKQEADKGRTPTQFTHYLVTKAKSLQKHIVLPEGEDDRILIAADEILEKKLAKLTILGDEKDINVRAQALNLNLSKANIVHPSTSPHFEEYVNELYKLRKHKGISMQAAKDMVNDLTYFGTMMVQLGHADGMVSGACHTTANTVRPAMQIIKTHKHTPVVSSIFFMCLRDGVRVYGDCAVNTNPTADELAVIAVTSVETSMAFGIPNPRVAMLSYATGDSNKGPLIDKVREATAKAREMRPDIHIYGPLQYDAAVNPSIAKKKVHEEIGAVVGGHANILIFPDLNTGNNTYKAVQQTNNCVAIGPVLQGLKKPVNDLSRGATIKDIVTTVLCTALQAGPQK